MCDESGATAWSYDLMGRVLTQRRRTAGVTYGIGYGYNFDGSVASVTSGVRTVTYTYSGAARALSAVDTANSINYATAAEYAPQGALTSLKNGVTGAFPQGITTTNTYNQRLQPITLSAAFPGQTVLSLSYDFGLGAANNGNVLGIANNRDSNRSMTFNYDQLNRIAFAWSNGPLWGERFEIDIWGNLNKIRACQSGDPCYGKPQGENLDQLANAKNQFIAFCYDAAGNLLKQAACPGQDYTYDAENRLRTAAGITYIYDGDGRRVRKNPGKLYWMGVGGEVLAETMGGTLVAEYIYFNGKRIARRDPNNAVHYYFSDHLGSANVITNATGSTVEDESDYYPFGGERVLTGADPNQYKFTGKERDSETGLDNFIARHYSSGLGRFLRPDEPFVDQFEDAPQSWNLYAYVRNNPLRNFDPTGQECVTAHDAEGNNLVADNGQGEPCEEVEGQQKEDEATGRGSVTVTERVDDVPLNPMAIAIFSNPMFVQAGKTVHVVGATLLAGGVVGGAGIAAGALGGTGLTTLGQIALSQATNLAPLVLPAGAKVAQMIARTGIGRGNPSQLLQHANEIRQAAIAAGTYVQNVNYMGSGSAIYRVGSTYMTVAREGTIRSIVVQAEAGRGVAQAYFNAGGR